MDFTLAPELDNIRLRTRAFVEEHVLPLEADRDNYDGHENIRLDLLARVQATGHEGGRARFLAVGQGLARITARPFPASC
ncbi:MAG: acyl-CoA dehydrogenase [Alphaproteobacteria bacterium]|nr:acyl-CoA dehydrogenase [Alphaproteobacteria bacterium]